MGYVYFAREEGPRGLVKIGYSKFPRKRVGAIRTEAGSRASLVALMRGGWLDERKEHTRFSESRVEGEWFAPTPELEARIEEVGLCTIGKHDQLRTVYVRVSSVEDLEAAYAHRIRKPIGRQAVVEFALKSCADSLWANA